MILRDYQAHGVADIRESYRRGRRAPLYVLPTGGGKSAVFAHIAQAAHTKGNRVMILVHRQELLSQASRQLAALGIAHGRIAPKARNTRDTIQVASVQTLARRLDRVKPPDLIIVDECHHSQAGQWRKIINAFPEARILGVTATPTRLDGQGLGTIAGGFYDDLILGPSVAELMAGGHLCNADVYAPANIDLSGVRRIGGDYDKKELNLRLDKSTITGDAISHYRRICDGQPAIAFCVSVLHAQHVAEQFRSAGYTAQCVDGKTDDAVRRQAIIDLGTGALNVLTSCEIISEGVDVPRVAVAILLRPTQSLGMHLQQCGRVLRPYPGKERSYILDHAGNCLRHGLPDEDREWTLEGRKRKPRESETVLSVRQCSQCFRVYKAVIRACPGCGFVMPVIVREVEQVDGELVKMEKDRQEWMRKQEMHHEVKSAKTLAELQALGEKRGYKPGWAKKRFEILESYKSIRHAGKAMH